MCHELHLLSQVLVAPDLNRTEHQTVSEAMNLNVGAVKIWLPSHSFLHVSPGFIRSTHFLARLLDW